MKKLSSLFLLALLPLMASAYDAQVDGIYYNLITKAKQAEVTSGDTKYTGSVTIPESFTYNGVTYSVTSIVSKAFYYCTGLTSVTIPNSVTSIGNYTFYNCSKLTSVTIPNSVTSIENWAFSNCPGLTSIEIPNSVTSIGSYAFYYCTGLTSVTIPNSVTSIGNCAFWRCSGLTSVTIPNSVTSIGVGAFQECSGLTSITIPNSVTSIENSAFKYCSGLTSVTIPNSVTSIGYEAFYKCSGLTSIEIPNSVKSIGNSAFYQCSGLTSIEIPNSVTSIGSSAFSDCTGLTSVTIPNSVTSIGNSAFWGCSGLTSVTIPNSVTSIGVGAFQDCSGLTSITIPNSVTSIGQSAFQSCSGLTSVTIPNSVTYIGGSAFASCSELTDVYCYAENVPSTSSDAFKDSYVNYATLYVPEASVAVYKAAELWSGFGTIKAIEGSEPVANDVAINETNFPDENFRNWILEQEYGKDGVLTATEIAGVTSIDVSNKSIKNLQGIEFFTALTYLQCGSNQLTSLDVSGCTKLVHLLCFNNSIKGIKMDALVESLPTSSNGSMYVIDYYNENNVMTTTQVAAARAKGWIPYYNNNKYYGNYEWLEYAGSEPTADIAINETNFPDENFRNWILEQEYGKDGVLTEEEIANVTSIKVSFKSIQNLTGIEYFTALTDLDCSYNRLTSLDLTSLNLLKSLLCYNNQLTVLDVSKNTLLRELSCSANQFTSLDVSGCTSLQNLGCSDNKLSSLDMSKNINLTSLKCSNNQLKLLDLSNNTNLIGIECWENSQLTSLDLSKNTKLLALWCYRANINGAGMDALVESLPTVSNKSMYVIYNTNEQNVMTTAQVTAAKAKGWTPRYFDGSNWLEYAGSEPEPEPAKKCATPTIGITEGKLHFSCETEGVTYVSHVEMSASFDGNSEDIALPKIKVTVYAQKEGYEDSDVAMKEIVIGSASSIRGDVNGDGQVSMPDAMFIVNKILNGKFPDE